MLTKHIDNAILNFDETEEEEKTVHHYFTKHIMHVSFCFTRSRNEKNDASNTHLHLHSVARTAYQACCTVVCVQCTLL
jgi:hypothetical protein